ncbi:DUF453-domain-containing protein [Clavulina sp. PMI_390]|nr:DUF453-domain-containing protein [Clavulina sp. PMI_390]
MRRSRSHCASVLFGPTKQLNTCVPRFSPSSSSRYLNMQGAVRTTFYRGGTSKGLFFRTQDLQIFSRARREAIILSAMGSPDPDGRQIDGLGGGISSLSKVAIVGIPGEPRKVEEHHSKSTGTKPLDNLSWPGDGPKWLDDVKRAQHPKNGWDVVYRFAQVGVREPVLDWATTCGNLVAAVAHFAVKEKLVYPQIDRHAATAGYDKTSSSPLFVTLKILLADTGKILRTTLPVLFHSGTGQWYPVTEGDTRISGVPGTAAPVYIETPLERAALPSGNLVDHVSIKGHGEIPVSIVDAGLPAVFVPASAITAPTSTSALDLLSMTPAELDSIPWLHPQLEAIRQAAIQTIPKSSHFTPSDSTPKICLVGPPSSYISTSGEEVLATGESMDCRVRPVSVGNFHRTVPATTLSTLAIAKALPDTVVAQQCSNRDPSLDSTGRKTLTIRVGQPAGISEATAVLGEADQPTSISYVRTARSLMSGYVHIPPSQYS